MGPLISVVMCTYNRAEILAGALGGLTFQETDGNFSYEIVVIDDASTDSTRYVVSTAASRSQVPIIYVRGEGLGAAHARNRGIRESRGEWIAFIDDDEVAEPFWLKELFAVAVRYGADCVGGTNELLLPDGNNISLTLVTRSLLGERTCRQESRVLSRKTLPATGNMLLKRSVLDSVGTFDVSLSRGGEDNDLATRIFSQGFTVWLAPKAVIHHLIPPYRLTVEYFKLVSFRWGENFSCIDAKLQGMTKTLLLCIARIGQALFVNVPLVVWAYLLCDRSQVLARKCLIWRAVAYVRSTLFLFAPRMFPQVRFFSSLEFRKERENYGATKPALPLQGGQV